MTWQFLVITIPITNLRMIGVPPYYIALYTKKAVNVEEGFNC